MKRLITVTIILAGFSIVLMVAPAQALVGYIGTGVDYTDVISTNLYDDGTNLPASDSGLFQNVVNPENIGAGQISIESGETGGGNDHNGVLGKKKRGNNTSNSPIAPVSEPATILLLGSGLIGLALGYGRKKFLKR